MEDWLSGNHLMGDPSQGTVIVFERLYSAARKRIQKVAT